SPRPASEPLEPAETGERVLVFGFDGATWDVLDPMIAAGRLPNLAALAARGRTFDLETISPTFSPVIWTTVATGTERFRHGIHDVVQTVLPGGVLLPRSIERTAFFTKTTGVLFRALHQANRLRLIPYRSSDVRAPSVFEAASEAGMSTSLVEWYVTWPAVELSGVTVSDRFHLQNGDAPLSAVVNPDALEEQVAHHIVAEDAVPAELVRRLADIDDLPPAEQAAWEQENAAFLREMRLNFARDLTTRNVAVDLLQRDRDWRLFGVYFRSVDLSHHLTWKFHRTAADGNPAGAPDARRLGDVVERYHEFMDGVVGEVLAQVPPEATIILLSDHGFEDVYDHRRGPDGFAIVAGGPTAPAAGGADGGVGADRGRISVYDVAPTVARLLGIPVADELPGTVREDILDPAFVDAYPPFRVTTWERADRSVATTGDALETDAAEIERLRALGYID
ncbi:MAG: hypothetical protein HKN12_02785, partial [Gemmatimonadetes bacterium]|nr:hypothetical protein [Gemmatimonadota bacterium]